VIILKTGYNVVDAMTRMVIKVSPGASIKDCAKLMEKEEIGSLLVHEKDILKGIITEQDVVRRVVSHGLDTSKTTVKEVMESRLVTIEPQEDLYDALVKMRDANVRHLPVVDKGKIAGILTIKDVLKVEPQLIDLIAEKFKLREEEQKPVFTKKSGKCEICSEYFDELNDAEGMSVCDECLENQDDDLEV